MARTAQNNKHAEAESTAESTTDEIIESDFEKTAATIFASNNDLT
jgi:hypothetical protein